MSVTFVGWDDVQSIVRRSHCFAGSAAAPRQIPLLVPNSSSLLFLAPNSSSMAPMHFLFFVSNSSANYNFLFLISLLSKLSHPFPTALPAATTRSSRAYGAHARCQKWWPSSAPEPAVPRPVGPGYEHAPWTSVAVIGSGSDTGDSHDPSSASHSWFIWHLLDMATDAVQLFAPMVQNSDLSASSCSMQEERYVWHLYWFESEGVIWMHFERLAFGICTDCIWSYHSFGPCIILGIICYYRTT
jgi:hypothetical protein